MRQKENTIAIYSRKSKFTGKGESIGNQIELCRDYVRRVFGGEYADRCVVFEDEGFSGGNLKRPDFQNMLQQVRQGRFKAIVVYRLDRISRNISDFAKLIDELTKLGVSFISIREQFDTRTPMGRAMMFIISVFSQLERETIAERIRDNMHELAKTGRWLGGNTPTGYTSEGVSHVAVDGKSRKVCHLKLLSQEAETVRDIFQLYMQTGSLTATESELLMRCKKTKNGKNFTRFAIKAILQNPVYMEADEMAYDYFVKLGAAVCSPKSTFDGHWGIMPYNRTAQEKGRTTVQLPVDAWIIAVGKHSPLIPSSQWIHVQHMLTQNGSKSYRRPRSHEALLTGRIYCACGAKMRPKLTGRQTEQGTARFTYVCKAKEHSHMSLCKVRNADGNGLDDLVFRQLQLLPWDEDQLIKRLQVYQQSYHVNQRQYNSQIKELQLARADNAKKQEGLIDSLNVLDGIEAKICVGKRIEELSALDRELETQIRELEKRASPDPSRDAEYQQIRQEDLNFPRLLAEMPTEFRRQAVAGLVQRVIWDGNTAHVVLLGAQMPGKQMGTVCEDSK